MISAPTLSCYYTLSSRILITNLLVTFLMLHSRHPVLQPINTYYSLIGAVYVFIASPLLVWYYPHVLSISLLAYLLAPPYFPEAPHSMFISQRIYSSLWLLLLASSLYVFLPFTNLVSSSVF